MHERRDLGKRRRRREAHRSIAHALAAEIQIMGLAETFSWEGGTEEARRTDS